MENSNILSYIFSCINLIGTQVLAFIIPISIFLLLMNLFFSNIIEITLQSKFNQLLLFLLIPGKIIYELSGAIVCIAFGGKITSCSPSFHYPVASLNFCFEYNQNRYSNLLTPTLDLFAVLFSCLISEFLFMLVLGREIASTFPPETINSLDAHNLIPFFKSISKNSLSIFRIVVTTKILNPFNIILLYLSFVILIFPLLSPRLFFNKAANRGANVTILSLLMIILAVTIFLGSWHEAIWQKISHSCRFAEYTLIVLLFFFFLSSIIVWSLQAGIKYAKGKRSGSNHEAPRQPATISKNITVPTISKSITIADQSSFVPPPSKQVSVQTTAQTQQQPMPTGNSRVKSFDKNEAERLLGSIENTFIGLDKVKSFCRTMYNRQLGYSLRDEKCSGMNNCIFMGNPGTGKTSVARKMGEFFAALGLISDYNIFIEIDPIADLTSKWQSEYTEKIRNVFNQAKSGILFIDEAHQLANNEQGHNVLDQIVKILTEPEYESILVIMAGYPEEMRKLYSINSGLKRRFPHEVVFDNFSPEELKEIFYQTMQAENQHIVPADRELFDSQLESILKKMARTRHFGNAGAVISYYRDVVKNNQIARILQDTSLDKFQLIPADLLNSKANNQESIDDILAELDRDFIGLEPLKKQIRAFANKIRFEKMRAEKIKSVSSSMEPGMYNMRFVGNPGTGKTTIARYMARIFCALEVIDNPHVKEFRGVDLKGSYVGQTKDKVNDIFENNPSHVIIIDEVYSLYDSRSSSHDSFSLEAIDTLVGAITDPRNASVILVIAGYKDRMDEFLSSNPGLERRFKNEILFPDYSDEECKDILFQMFKKEHYLYPDTVDFADQVKSVFAHLRRTMKENFGNGGTVASVFNQIIENLSSRIFNSGDDVSEEALQKIIPDDLPSDNDDCNENNN